MFIASRRAFVAPAPRRLYVFMNRDPRFALSQELEAKQTLLDQIRALAVEDPDFLTDLLEGETKLPELSATLDRAFCCGIWAQTAIRKPRHTFQPKTTTPHNRPI
jgi:hypothetical protein